MSSLRVRGYDMVFMKDDFSEKLKEERKKRKYPFEEMNKSVPENPANLYFGDHKNSVDDSITINSIGVREGILRFAVAMEEEMRKKDKKYADSKYKELTFRIEHLKKERKEVDHEFYLLKGGDKFFVKTELVHEAIMCMLVSDAILEKLPHCKLCGGDHWIGQLCDGEGKRL